MVTRGERVSVRPDGGRPGQHRGVRSWRTPKVDPGLPGIVGTVRPVRPDKVRPDPAEATRRVASRVEAGDIAVIDQLDLDRVSAQALVAARPAAVVNVRSSLSGRHPALGAAVVVDSGIPLVDDVGPGLLSVVRDGQTVRLHDGSLYDARALLGHGLVRGRADVEAAQDRARVGMAGRLEAVGADMAGYLRAHEGLLLEGDGLPAVSVHLSGRPVLIVTPGERAATEVRQLRAWVRERRPVVICADSGVESATRARVRPHLVIGHTGATNVRKAERIEAADLPEGLSATDLAVLVAVCGAADLIVLAGAPASYDELLDRDRETAASLFAVRLRAGDRLVDAAAVAELHRPAVSLLGALAVAVAGLVAVAASFAATPGGRDLFHRLLEVLPW